MPSVGPSLCIRTSPVDYPTRSAARRAPALLRTPPCRLRGGARGIDGARPTRLLGLLVEVVVHARRRVGRLHPARRQRQVGLSLRLLGFG